MEGEPVAGGENFAGDLGVPGFVPVGEGGAAELVEEDEPGKKGEGEQANNPELARRAARGFNGLFR